MGVREPPLSKVRGYCTPTFKRYKRLSFELKLRRNAWAAGALPRTSPGERTALPQTPILTKGPTSKDNGRGREGKEGGEEGREDEGKWNPHFLGESYAPGHQEGHRIPIDLILNRFLY